MARIAATDGDCWQASERWWSRTRYRLRRGLLAECGARVTALEEAAPLLAIAREALAEFAPSANLVSGPLGHRVAAGCAVRRDPDRGGGAFDPADSRCTVHQETGRLVARVHSGPGRGRRCSPRRRPPGCARGRCSTAPRPPIPSLCHRPASFSDRRWPILRWLPAVAEHTGREEERSGHDPSPRLGIGSGVALAAAPAFGQAPTSKPAPVKPTAATRRAIRAPAPQTASAQPSQPGVPRTLAEALAATYANQPALQAERAKLRSTDENVPQALAGWRPTVVMAGTAGYGDGFSRIYLAVTGSSTLRPIG